MMVARTEGNMSKANLQRYFSMPALPRRFVAESLRRIEGPSATDRWQTPDGPRSRLQFDLQKYDLVSGLVEHVVLDAGFAEVGLARAKLRFRTFATGRHDRHLAGSHGDNDVIHLMNVMSGRTARGEPPLGDADLRAIDLNLRFGANHGRWSPPGFGCPKGYRIQFSMRTAATSSSSSGITSLRSLGIARDTAVTASHPLDDVLGHFLCVAEQHHGVVAVEQRIVDAGIA